MPRGWWGALPGGGWPVTVVRGVWCQALSLPRPPVLWRGQPGFRDPCVPGAVGAGVGTQHQPHSVRPCGPALLAVGVAEGRSRGGAFHCCEGRLWSGAPPRRTARPLGGLLGSATHMLCARACGCGGPTLSLWPACPVRAACRGGGGGPSPGGVACHGCEGRLVSGAVPLPAARPLERAAGVPRPVCPRCGRCGRGDPAPAPQRAPLRTGVAGCGGDGRAFPGGGAFHCCEGRLWSGAPPPRTARPLGGLFGSATHVLWARVCGRGDSSPTPQRALLGAGFARCGGGMRVRGRGALCLGVGRPGSGALRPPTTRPFGRAAWAHYPLAVGAGVAGLGTRHLPHSERSCELALRAVEAARGRPGGAPLARVWGVRVGRSPTPDHLSLRACGQGPLPAGPEGGVLAWGHSCPWHLVLWRGLSCVVRPSWVRGTRWPLWFDTCHCAVVVAGSVPLWRASWPRFGAPLLLRSGRSRCSGRLSRRRGAFPDPGGCRPRLYWVAARGTWRPAEHRAPCARRWPLPRQGRLVRSASYPFGAPRWGCPWRVPPALVLRCVRCSGLACVDPVTDASGFPYGPSFHGGLGHLPPEAYAWVGPWFHRAETNTTVPWNPDGKPQWLLTRNANLAPPRPSRNRNLLQDLRTRHNGQARTGLLSALPLLPHTGTPNTNPHMPRP